MEKTEKACRELLKTYPRSLVVISTLGMALKGQGKLHAAVQAFDKEIEIKPSYAAYGGRGNILHDLGQLKEALKSYDKAIEIEPGYAVYDGRGNVLKALGQLKEAVKSFEKAIEIKSDYAEAHLHLSALKKYKPDDVHVELMEHFYTDSESSGPDHMYFCFALAKAYEDLGEYDKSFNYITEGNQLRNEELNYHIDNDRKKISRIKEFFDAGSLDIVPVGNTLIQNIFIVGMPRSGTSLVEQILASHTKVHGAGELERMGNLVNQILTRPLGQNVGQDKIQLSKKEINSVYNGYLGALAELNVSEKIITDKNPYNFQSIGFILSAFPEAKIVHLSRDSRATCWSIYKRCFSSTGNGYAYDPADLVEYYKLYIDLMSFWRERYPDSIYDLCYEELTNNQEQETRNLLEFCNLEWEEQCLDFHKTKNVVRTTSSAQVRKKM
ncbi:MAG: sulfotransferase, partial [Candidatus Heimdallarchaeota archaeon]